MNDDRRKFLKNTGLAGLGLTGLGLGGPAIGKDIQQTPNEGDLRLLDWEPVPQLVVKETIISKPRFPVIDIHNHLDHNHLEDYLKTMDEVGVWKVVSLNGRSADNYYIEHVKACQKVNGSRFI